ncbi:MAG: hypothetical protein H0T46_25470 [Deltaproteobacteria bacterium]|nr:hypothetical protein [Deltaproteobacteria bacterium]
MRSLAICTAFVCLTAACADEAKQLEEELEVLDDSKADSHLRPTNHGPIAFGSPAHSALTTAERFHAWTFDLSGSAAVDMTTSYSVLGQRRTDTVLYLYKEGASGWGSYIARNDDYGSTTYSQLKRTLAAGRYRILVKGHLASTRGKFKVTVGCSGTGCGPPAPVGCLFGETYGDIAGNPALQVINTNVITPATLTTLDVDDRDRLMLAVQQSSHTDVTTPEEAILRVDQDEVNVTWLYETAAKRSYIAFEYGAGDNSYGAIFDRYSGQMVTNIHDGDLERCIVTAETCLFADDWNAVKTDPDFALVSTTTVTQASQLSGVGVDQAMGALRASYDDLTSLADGISRTDDRLITLYELRHTATNTVVQAFVYHAGDTAVGRIYYRNTTDRAAAINDLFIEGCTLFE